MTKCMTDQAVEAVYLFIAELNGYKRGTVEGKLEFGKQCYMNNVMPEASGDELSDHIWLSRLYRELSQLYEYFYCKGTYKGYHWTVPIELDAGASMLGITGALLGDVRLLTMTNMAGDEDVLNDPWHIEGLTRSHTKSAAMPRLYGSDQPAHVLWKKANLDYDLDMLHLMNDQFSSGAIGLADTFKNFVINNCNPKPEMDVVIFGEEFTIKCNHYKRVGDVHAQYDLYDSSTQRIRRVTHTKTRMVPDLERFKRYFQTLLI